MKPYEGFLEHAEPEEIYDTLRSILLEVCSYYDLLEVSRDEVTENQGEIVRHTVTTKGLFTDQDHHVGVWPRALPQAYLPKALREVVKDAKEVNTTYEGEKYFLTQHEGKAYGFNAEYYSQLSNIVAKELDYYTHTPVNRILLDTKRRVLILESTWVYLAVAGINRPDLEEEERVILSERLAQSQPFFSFKTPIQVDWRKLKEDRATNFERLCESLLLKERDIERVIPIGKPHAADRGRDFEVHEVKPIFGAKQITKWLVQCKFSDNSVSPTSISGWTDRVLEHRCDGYWLMTNNDLTPTLIDQFKGVEDNPNAAFQVRFWQRSDLHVKLNVYSEILTDGRYFLGKDDE